MSLSQSKDSTKITQTNVDARRLTRLMQEGSSLFRRSLCSLLTENASSNLSFRNFSHSRIYYTANRTFGNITVELPSADFYTITYFKEVLCKNAYTDFVIMPGLDGADGLDDIMPEIDSGEYPVGTGIILNIFVTILIIILYKWQF